MRASGASYRAALPAQTAVDIIMAGAGTHFERSLSELVVRLHERADLLPGGWDA